MSCPRTHHLNNVPRLRGEKHDIPMKILRQAGFETARQAVTSACRAPRSNHCATFHAIIPFKFSPLEVVSRYRDPRPQVRKKTIFNFRTNVSKFWWINTYLILKGSDLKPFNRQLFNLNFHPLEVVSRWRDPQLQMSENYSDLTKWR